MKKHAEDKQEENEVRWKDHETKNSYKRIKVKNEKVGKNGKTV